MQVLLIILVILLILIFAFLFTPIIFYIDTEQKRYEIFQAPVFRFFVTIENNTIKPKLKLAGITIPLKSGKPKAEKKKKPKTKSRFKKSTAAWRFLVGKILRSFKIRRAIVDLDTDDVVLNAQLVPVFLAISQGPFHLTSNFAGRVYFHLEMNNKPARILWIFIQFLTKK